MAGQIVHAKIWYCRHTGFFLAERASADFPKYFDINAPRTMPTDTVPTVKIADLKSMRINGVGRNFF